MTAPDYAPFTKALYDFHCTLIGAAREVERACRRGAGALTRRSEVLERLFDLHTRLVTWRTRLAASAPEAFLVDSGLSAEYIKGVMRHARDAESELRRACTGGAKLSEVRSLARSAALELNAADYGICTMLESARKLEKAADEKTSPESE